MIATTRAPRSNVLHAAARRVIELALRHAADRERCGALFGRCAELAIVVEHAVELANLEARTERFRIDPGALVACARAAEERGEELVGFFHTHPADRPRPSRADRAGAWDGHVVLVATSAGARAFWPSASGFAELACYGAELAREDA